jgi:hypothetical protein
MIKKKVKESLLKLEGSIPDEKTLKTGRRMNGMELTS